MEEITALPQENEDNTGNAYSVDLPLFQGPLDLLLSLIEQEEMDITKISLARVTNQYLSHLEILKATDPDALTDFLVIAAKLILIKSEVLLPRPPAILIEEGEEDVGDELARQLRIYKQFKEIAAHLQEVEERGQRSFVRVVPKIKIEPKLIPGEGDIEALLIAARSAMSIKPEDPDVDDVVSREVVTIGQQMGHILERVDSGRPTTFRSLLRHANNRVEIIVTLLAILELIKRRIVKVEQTSYFGEIIINRRTDSKELSENEWTELSELTDVS